MAKKIMGLSVPANKREFSFFLHKDAKFLSSEVGPGHFILFFLSEDVEWGAEEENHLGTSFSYIVLETGHLLPDNAGEYLTTVYPNGYSFALHIFAVR